MEVFVWIFYDLNGLPHSLYQRVCVLCDMHLWKNIFCTNSASTLSIIFQCYCQYAPCCAIQIQMTHWYQRQPGYTKPTGRSIMNWHVNGRASMPCDAPIFIDFNIHTPPRNSPSLLPLTHQHRLKLAMARILLNLSQYSGPRNPQANVIDLNFSQFRKSVDS